MAPMMVLFEVHVAPGSKPFELSEELLAETKAQVMTPAEAKAVGFNGLPEPPAGREVKYIAVAQRDQRWVQQALEASPAVAGFRVHDVG